VDVAQRVFGEDAVLGLAEDETDGRRVVLEAEEVVDGGAVEVHLSGILGFEVALLEIDDDEAAEVEVIEEEVEVELAVADFEAVLAADKGKAATEFEEEFFEMPEESGFEFAFVEGFFKGEEIEEVGIFEEALGEGGVGFGEGGGEVGDSGTLALVGAILDLCGEGVSGPALFDGLAGIPKAGGKVLNLLHQGDVGAPRQFCNGALQNREHGAVVQKCHARWDF